MASKLVIRPSTPADADAAADYAAAERVEYERYSPVFWRRSRDDRARHRPFLAACIESPDFAALTAELDGEVAGVVLADRRGAPPPFRDDPEPTWFVDDLVVARSDVWDSVGRRLVEDAAAAARASGANRLVVVCARLDDPKRSLLLDAGFETAAFWWVRPLTPTDAPAPDTIGVEAAIGSAPPVYDPGGPVALAASLADPADVPRFDRWAAGRGAVLAIVPARTSHDLLAAALEAAGYERASEWFLRRL